MPKSKHILIYQISFPARALVQQASLAHALLCFPGQQPSWAGLQLWTEAGLPVAQMPTGGKVRREGEAPSVGWSRAQTPLAEVREDHPH